MQIEIGEELPEKLLADDGSYLGDLEVEDVLDHIVGEGVLHELPSVPGYRDSERLPLLSVRRVYALLHDAAAVHVAGDEVCAGHHGIVDELLVL